MRVFRVLFAGDRELFLQLYKSLVRSRLIRSQPFKSHSLTRLQIGTRSFPHTSPALSLCAEAAEPPLLYCPLILTSNFLVSVSQFPQLPIYNSIFLTEINQLPAHANKQIRYRFQQSLRQPFYPNFLQPIHTLSPLWAINEPFIRFDIT